MMEQARLRMSKKFEQTLESDGNTIETPKRK